MSGSVPSPEADKRPRVPATLTTEWRYKKFVVQKRLGEDVETLETGGKILWVGARTASAVIVYVHGGGLCQPVLPGQLALVADGYATLQQRNQDASFAIVEYGLAPHVTYPTQLQHVLDAVNHLLQTRSPEKIHFMADSAGGQLVLALLLHHAHAHPLLEPLALGPGQGFGQALLLSPSGAVPTATASMRQSPVKDTLKPDTIRRFFDTVRSNCNSAISLPGPWMALYETPESWWCDLPVGRIVITVGEDEVLRDDILVFACRIMIHHRAAVEIRKAAGEGHDQPVMDMTLGGRQVSASGHVVKEWFEEFRV